MLYHHAKILKYGVECTDLDILHSQYDLAVKIKRFDPDQIARDWSLISASWKFLDEPNVSVVSVRPDDVYNDYGVVCALHDAISKADILVGHNSDNFDFKKFKTRAIKYGLPPIDDKISIDTLKEARKKFKFTSNKLSYLCKFLGVSEKSESPDWEKIKAGDRDELAKCRQYNKQDVISTEQVYLKLRAWMSNHPSIIPHIEIIRDTAGFQLNQCKVCGSPNLKKNGKIYTRAGRGRQRYCCRDCGSYS